MGSRVLAADDFIKLKPIWVAGIKIAKMIIVPFVSVRYFLFFDNSKRKIIVSNGKSLEIKNQTTKQTFISVNNTHLTLPTI